MYYYSWDDFILDFYIPRVSKDSKKESHDRFVKAFYFFYFFFFMQIFNLQLLVDKMI